MGNFDPRYVTHLILDERTGSKYDHWIEHGKLHLRHLADEGKANRRNTTKMTTMKNEEEEEVEGEEGGPLSSLTTSPYVWTTKLQLVTTAWVEACIREGRRVSEDQYRLPTLSTCIGIQLGALSSTTMIREEEDRRISHVNDAGDGYNTKTAADDDIVTPSGGKWEVLIKRIPSLVKRCEYVLQQQQQQQLTTIDDENVNSKRQLFAGQSFLLVGFDDDDDTHRHNDDKNVKNILSKLIRKFGGTIYYEPNEWITMVVLLLTNINNDNDSSNKETVVYDETKEKNDNNIYLQRKLLWNDIQYFCREHPNGPICVDVDYILSTVYTNGDWEGVNNPAFPAEPLPPVKTRSRQTTVSKQQQQKQQKKAKSETNGGGSVSTTIIASERKMKSNSPSKKKSKPRQLKNDNIATSSLLQKSDIFHGDVFVIIPSVTTITDDNSGTSHLFLGYNNGEMETTIIKHGGTIINRLLSSETIYTLQDEFAAFRKTTLTHGTNYVISNIHTKDYEQTEEISGGVVDSGGSIELIHVSSVWVAACVEHGCKYDPTGYPMLFQPQTWPIHLLPRTTTSTTTPSQKRRKVRRKHQQQ